MPPELSQQQQQEWRWLALGLFEEARPLLSSSWSASARGGHKAAAAAAAVAVDLYAAAMQALAQSRVAPLRVVLELLQEAEEEAVREQAGGRGGVVDLRCHAWALVACREAALGGGPEEEEEQGESMAAAAASEALVQGKLQALVETHPFYRWPSGGQGKGSLASPLLVPAGSSGALAVMQAMLEDGQQQPDSSCYSAALEACAWEGRPERVLLLFEKMRARPCSVALVQPVERAASSTTTTTMMSTGAVVGGPGLEDGAKVVTHFTLQALEAVRQPLLADHVYASALADGLVRWCGSDEEGAGGGPVVLDLHNQTVPLARAALRHVYNQILLATTTTAAAAGGALAGAGGGGESWFNSEGRTIAAAASAASSPSYCAGCCRWWVQQAGRRGTGLPWSSATSSSSPAAVARAREERRGCVRPCCRC